MATSPKILLIRYADKLAFLIALGILGYVAATSFLLKGSANTGQTSQLQDIRKLQACVRKLIGTSEPTPEKVPVLTGQLRERWRKVPQAVELRPWVFVRPRPKKYDPVKLRVGQTKVIETLDHFTSHRFVGDPIIKVGEIKGCKVTIVAEEKGSVTLVGEDAKGVTHEIPVLVLPPKAPIVLKPAEGFEANATLGQVALSWTAAQKPPAGVEKLEWAVFRRHEGDPVDQFRQIGKTEDTEYVDKGVKSGEKYYYFVQALAQTEDGVKESKRSPTVKIIATSMVEFKLVSATSEIALVEVRRYFQGEWITSKFSVRRGGLIGGLEKGVDFSTNCTLVDILTKVPRIFAVTKELKKVDQTGKVTITKVKQKLSGRANKIIYEDRKGNARVAWQIRPTTRKPTRTGKPEAIKDKNKAPAAGGDKAIIKAVD